jgi:thiamine biosynthesis lipoprotein
MTDAPPAPRPDPVHFIKQSPALKLGAAAVILAVLLFIALPLVYKGAKGTKTYGRLLMGTLVEVTLTEGEDPGAAEKAFSEIERLPTSDVSKVTASAGSAPVSVSEEVIEVLGVALEISRLTRGAFDPTFGALTDVWDFSGDGDYVPSSEEVEGRLELVDYRKIIIDRPNSKAGLVLEGMRLNLGGVAKGYIVGKGVEALKKEGVGWGIIKAGGDMVVFRANSTDPPGEPFAPFTVGIQDPRRSGALLGKLAVAAGAVATSGDYERFFIKDGVRYHHILDPSTGYPARRTRSVTVIARDPTGADALSTGLFVMGAAEGMELVEATDGVEAVIVDSKGEVHVSSGLKGGLKGSFTLLRTGDGGRGAGD